jgi:hypothetical protein
MNDASRASDTALPTAPTGAAKLRLKAGDFRGEVGSPEEKRHQFQAGIQNESAAVTEC